MTDDPEAVRWENISYSKDVSKWVEYFGYIILLTVLILTTFCILTIGEIQFEIQLGHDHLNYCGNVSKLQAYNDAQLPLLDQHHLMACYCSTVNRKVDFTEFGDRNAPDYCGLWQAEQYYASVMKYLPAITTALICFICELMFKAIVYF